MTTHGPQRQPASLRRIVAQTQQVVNAMPRLIKRHSNSQTATVAELIAKLAEYPPDMAVAYTWEGQITPVDFSEIEVMQETDQVFGPVLLLNAET